MLFLRYFFTGFMLVLIIFFRFLIDFILFCRFLINVEKGQKMTKNTRKMGRMLRIVKPVQISRKPAQAAIEEEKKKENQTGSAKPDRPVQLNRFT